MPKNYKPVEPVENTARNRARRFRELYEARQLRTMKKVKTILHRDAFDVTYLLEKISWRIPKRTLQIFQEVRDDWDSISERRLWYYLSMLYEKGFVKRLPEGGYLRVK